MPYLAPVKAVILQILVRVPPRLRRRRTPPPLPPTAPSGRSDAGAHLANSPSRERRSLQRVRKVVRTPIHDLGADIMQNLPYRRIDRKSTRLNSSHGYISYAVFCF